MHDAAQCCACAEEGVSAGRDAGDVRGAGGEEGGVGETLVQGLDEDADHATEGGADGHAGDEDAGGDFAAVGDDDEEDTERRREEEGDDHAPAHAGVAERVVIVPAFAF